MAIIVQAKGRYINEWKDSKGADDICSGQPLIVTHIEVKEQIDQCTRTSEISAPMKLHLN
jgi:hypothetical protein